MSQRSGHAQIQKRDLKQSRWRFVQDQAGEDCTFTHHTVQSDNMHAICNWNIFTVFLHVRTLTHTPGVFFSNGLFCQPCMILADLEVSTWNRAEL